MRLIGVITTLLPLVFCSPLYDHGIVFGSAKQLEDETKDHLRTPNYDVQENFNLRLQKREIEKWHTTKLTYMIEGCPVNTTEEYLARKIDEAFKQWEAVSPFTFSAVKTHAADIILSFKGNHSIEPETLAFATGPPPYSEIHYNVFDYTWNNEADRLFFVSVHEIGHILGLDHSPDLKSTMYATCMPELNPRITAEDAVQLWRRYPEQCREESNYESANEDYDEDLTGKWPRKTLSYTIKGSLANLTEEYLHNMVEDEFKKWEAVSPFTFTAIHGSPADIVIHFMDDDHVKANVVGPSRMPGLHSVIDFDGYSDTWTNETERLAFVTLREIGHILGLFDNMKDLSSVMSPVTSPGKEPRITATDIVELWRGYEEVCGSTAKAMSLP